jgi:hypothetical protein
MRSAAGKPTRRRTRLPFNHENHFSNAELAEQEPIPEPKTKAYSTREKRSEGSVLRCRSSLRFVFPGSTAHAGVLGPHNKPKPSFHLPCGSTWSRLEWSGAELTTRKFVMIPSIKVVAEMVSYCFCLSCDERAILSLIPCAHPM